MRIQERMKKETVSLKKKRIKPIFDSKNTKKPVLRPKNWQKTRFWKFVGNLPFFIIGCFWVLYSLMIPHYDRTNLRLEPKNGGF